MPGDAKSSALRALHSAPLHLVLSANVGLTMAELVSAVRFIAYGAGLSVVLTYIALELLPKVYTVLPSWEALFAIVISVALGFGLSAYIVYFRDCDRGKRKCT